MFFSADENFFFTLVLVLRNYTRLLMSRRLGLMLYDMEYSVLDIIQLTFFWPVMREVDEKKRTQSLKKLNKRNLAANIEV